MKNAKPKGKGEKPFPDTEKECRRRSITLMLKHANTFEKCRRADDVIVLMATPKRRRWDFLITLMLARLWKSPSPKKSKKVQKNP